MSHLNERPSPSSGSRVEFGSKLISTSHSCPQQLKTTVDPLFIFEVQSWIFFRVRMTSERFCLRRGTCLRADSDIHVSGVGIFVVLTAQSTSWRTNFWFKHFPCELVTVTRVSLFLPSRIEFHRQCCVGAHGESLRALSLDGNTISKRP